ncbi:Tetratricopeptide repeat protein like [Heracleum sosnowskyi]|uniref:Tetratricopeptide repeat protein like n=1 Tax=Heracleum sosnowskyi TaxID=360622 RepID=A0AAD8JJH9_9APIA|nr:Tetratricopeptide repeat protein like [Heracleum sosnowskyi]
MKRSQESTEQDANETNNTRKCLRWTPAEDRILVTAISDLLDMGGWKADNGQFKNGAWAKVEAIMHQILPSCEKIKPHIDSRVKLLRKQYDVVAKMLSPSASGW